MCKVCNVAANKNKLLLQKETASNLRWALEIQDNAAALGFDWTTAEPVFDKVTEELAEVKMEHTAIPVQQAFVVEEIGDLLFAVVNLARHLQVNPEQALAAANKKFIQRFQEVERLVQQGRGCFNAYQLAELESFWQQAKTRLSSERGIVE